MAIQVKIKRMTEKNGSRPAMPAYETAGAAAMDLRYFGEDRITLLPSARALVPTGLFMEIPEGFAAFIFSRSGMAAGEGIMLSNSVGVIDSDYRGEVKVGLYNASEYVYTIEPGARIAQMVVLPVPQVEMAETETLAESGRGSGGFGSTGQ